MGTTYLRLSQVRKADTFTDTLNAAQIAAIEGTAVDEEDFLGGILSQFNKVIGATNWWDNVQNASLQPRNLKTLTDDIYYKDMLRRRQVLVHVTVPAQVKSTGTINHVAVASLVNGDNFILDDDQNPAITFYYDVTGAYVPPGGYGPTKIHIDLSVGGPPVTADDVKVVTNAAINGVVGTLLITATSGGVGITTLTHDQFGSYNVAVIENVGAALFTVSGMTGGAGNTVTLSDAAGETPSETAAVDNGHAEGCVVKDLAGDVGIFSLDDITGLNNINPKNLVVIRDAITFDPIESGGRQIFGLLQAEAGVADGDNFDDANKQVQISFVRPNPTSEDLELCPAADIQGKVIEYSYVSRAEWHSLNEQDFLVGAFQDSGSAASITLQNAYIGGNTINVQTAEGNLEFNLDNDLTSFKVLRNTASFATFLRDDTTGDKLTLDLDILDINNVTDADFLNGAKFDTGGTTINVGVVAGQIDATVLTVASSAGDLLLSASAEVKFTTVREAALPLDDATAGAVSALPGGPFASVSAAIKKALSASDLDIFVQTITTSHYAQDANVPGSGNGNAQDWVPALSLTSRTISMLSADIANCDTLIFLNGTLLRGGTGATNNDVYKGTTPANGDLMYDFAKGVHIGDMVTAVSWYVP